LEFIRLTSNMQTVVVGGHSRNIGKTSVMAGLIRNLQSLNWTAVKITQYGHGICSQDGEPCGCAPTEHAFVLSEESDEAGRSDTSRFLSAGAHRALWLRVRHGQLGEAFPLLQRAWSGDDWVMIESNSIMDFIKPSLYLVVLDGSQGDFKPSAHKFLGRADALIPIRARVNKSSRRWPMIDSGVFEDKPIFPLAPGHYSSLELCRFVRQRLLGPEENYPLETSAHPTGGKEQPCQR
jgi:hypothetical protein